MSPRSDHHDEMPRNAALDERGVEAILAGDAGATHPELSAFVAEMRAASAGPVPAPSPALSNLFLHGFSTEKGDLPATAASNVTGPARQAAGLPKWRKCTMAVKQFIAGLSIAGKLTMGVGVAAAATTGAGSAGVLPDPVQHEFARAVDSFVPFDVKDPEPVAELGPPEHHDVDAPAAAREEAPAPTAPPSTTVVVTTTAPAAPKEPAPAPAAPGVEQAPATTEAPHAPSTTAPPATTVPAAPTTTTGETKVPENLSIRCEQNAAWMSVNCFWTVLAPTQSETAQYIVLRVGPDGNRAYETWDPAARSYTDIHVEAGVTYQYMVIAVDASKKNLGHSSYVPVAVVAR